MCLILLAHELHPRYRLVLAANRDEFHARPTERARFWPDDPRVLAGRDLLRGGTWMGVTRSGRWAAVTNVREWPPRGTSEGPSRGHLVSDFLTGGAGPEEYARALEARGSEYQGFNLLVGDGAALWYLSNRDPGGARTLPPGLYGVSNHLLDTPWPKVERGKRALASLLEEEPLTAERLLDPLLDRVRAADEELPDTGVGAERERALSAAFIVSPGYGTRASTALLMERAGEVTFVERGFLEGGEAGEEVRYGFRLASSA